MRLGLGPKTLVLWVLLNSILAIYCFSGYNVHFFSQSSHSYLLYSIITKNWFSCCNWKLCLVWILYLLMIYFQSQGSAFMVSTKGADLILMLILKWYGLFRLGTNTPLSMVIIACIILRQRFFLMKKIQWCSFDE